MARVAGHRRRPAARGPRPRRPLSRRGAGAAARPDEPDLLVVGRIGKPQGIKGEVTVQVRTDDPDARFAAGAVLLADPAERGPLTVASSRWQNGRLVVAFDGVADRNAAEALRETLLQVDARTLPPPEDEDEFHDHVLRGMAAELTDGSAARARWSTCCTCRTATCWWSARADTGAEVLVPFVEGDGAGRRRRRRAGCRSTRPTGCST